MVTKPDFSKERKEYQEVEAILRRRALLSLLAMALQSSLVANFNLPAFLKIFFIIMYIVQGLVLGMCVFLSWYQKYKLKRLTQGRELWYFWARVGEGIKYFFIARTRKTRAERRAHDKTYKVSVESAAKSANASSLPYKFQAFSYAFKSGSFTLVSNGPKVVLLEAGENKRSSEYVPTQSSAFYNPASGMFE